MINIKKYCYLPICNFKKSSEATTFYVYGLIHPITEELRYIGQAYNLRERMSQHCCDLRGNTYKSNWIKSLKKQKLTPIMIILENHNSLEEVLEAEIYLIAYYRYIGYNLINETDGGEGRLGSEQKFETRKQISKTLKKNKNKIENNKEKELVEYIKDKPINVNKRIASQYVKDVASKTHKGKTMSPESRKKMSDGLKGENHPFWGKKLSDDHILKSVDARPLGKNKKLSFEKAEEIRKLYSTGNYTLQDLGSKYGVAFTTISKIINNYRYKKEMYNVKKI